MMRRTPPIPVTASAGFPHERPYKLSLGWRPIALTVLLILAATAATVRIDTSSGPATSGAAGQALSDARAFLREYVAPSGRVVRRDQGDTTVSEGQAYAMLLSEATGQQATFERVWRWTRTHLLRPNGELAYLAGPDGSVQDPTPASDADVLTAWALSRATGPLAAEYHVQARRMSDSILGDETVSRGGLLLLAAGPWATGSPASLDPSYWSLNAFEDLGRFTGDRRWDQLATSARTVIGSITGDGAALPPDWARLDGSLASPTPAPSGQEPQVRYGLDAQRLAVWMSASCTPSDRRIAARWWKLLSGPSRASALALSPSGSVIERQTNALPYVAAAATAGAAGDLPARRRLLADARRTQTHYPTYYGGAWLALGETLLDTGRLGGCTTERS